MPDAKRRFVTRYLERALAGDAANADDWNEHLIAFHRAFPDVTAQLIGRFQTAEGENSYQRLARHVYEQYPAAQRILDVGCGSGELLQHLDAFFDAAAELAGIDLVETELEIARRRVSHATLICADAAQTQPVQRIDVAVAHLSFLSMTRLRDALGLIHDALRPGGILTFIIEDLSASDSIVAMMIPLMRALHERYPQMNLAVPERDGVDNEVTLRALLKSTGFTNRIDIEPLVLSAQLVRDQIAEFALRAYPFALLEESAQAELRSRLHDTLARNRDGGTLVKLPLKLVTARRASAMSNDRLSTVTEHEHE